MTASTPANNRRIARNPAAVPRRPDRRKISAMIRRCFSSSQLSSRSRPRQPASQARNLAGAALASKSAGMGADFAFNRPD